MLLFDGAFGTYYALCTAASQRGIAPEFAVRDDPTTVEMIHRQYLSSGANAIKTDTFGVNEALIADKDARFRLIQTAYEIASVAAADYNADVYADIGPIPFSEERRREEGYLELVKMFLSCGARYFLFETMPELTPLLKAVAHIRCERADAVVVISFAVSTDGYTQTGGYYKPLLRAAARYADHAGLNCLCGPVHMKTLLDGLAAEERHLIIMPNAGYPALENGRMMYGSSPEYFAQKAVMLAESGVLGLGGCCGTTPKHILALANALAKRENSAAPTPKRLPLPQERALRRDPLYQHKLHSWCGKPVAVEIPAPDSLDCTFTMQAAQRLKEAGADYITIPDAPLAKARADSILTAAKIARETGVSVIPHMTCRDRNLIAIKGQLIAAGIEGIREILAITGDPVEPSVRGEIKNVFQFSSVGLISYMERLNEEVFRERPFYVCAALNTSAVHFASECKRAQKKIDAGAQCLFTQPIYSEQGVNRVREAKEMLSVPIFVGLMPVAGYKNALFLNNEVTGIDIPESLLEELKGKEKEQVKEISLRYCRELIDAVYDLADGFYLMTPMKKVDFTLELLQYVRMKGRKTE